MSKLTFYKPPEIQKGYIFNPQKSFFSVVIPEETTNLIYNPETQHLNDFDVGVEFGELDGDPSIELDYDNVLFGVSSVHVILQSNTYLLYDLITTLNPDTVYTFSIYMKGYGGVRLAVYNEETEANHAVGRVIDLNPELWTRHLLKFTTPGVGEMENAQIRILGINTNSDFYIAGMQLEEKPYATTFCSGNQLGLITGETPKPYFWMGPPNNSPSIRLATTRDGGKIVSFENLGFHVTGFNGFGLPEFEVITSPLASGMGSVYQGSSIESREMEICGILMSPSVQDFFRSRGLLSHSMQPNISGIAQPLKLIYSVYECDKQACEQIEIYAIYQSGLEGQIESLLGEEICISFVMTDPLFKRLGNNSKILNVYKEVLEHRPDVVGTDINGEWQVMEYTNDLTNTFVPNRALAVGPDNYLYGGGASTLSGTGDGALIARWNGSSWDTIGYAYEDDGVTLKASSVINVIIPGPNGTLYVGGEFLAIGNANGVISVLDGDGSNIANPDSRLNIARYDITTDTWHYIGRFLNDIGGSNSVQDMKLLHDGIIDTAVLNGKIMIVGKFRQPEGLDEIIHTNSRNIITYNPETNTFEVSVPVGNNDFANDDDSIIYSIDQAPNGEIWIGGDFRAYGNIELPGPTFLEIENIAVWGRYIDNVTDTYLGFEGATGALDWGNIVGGSVFVVKVAPNGTVYIGGNFSASQIFDDIHVVYPPHILVSTTSVLNSSAAFGFAQLTDEITPSWYSPFILGTTHHGTSFSDENQLGIVYDFEFDTEGNIHIVGKFNFANTIFPNLDYEDLPASSTSWTVIDALETQEKNCNGYIIWDGNNFIQPDILFSETEGFGTDEGDPRIISQIELGALNANRFSEHASAPIPSEYQFSLAGTGATNISPSFDKSIFLSPLDGTMDFIAKDIVFIDLDCNDYSKPIFIINGPGTLRSIINETTGATIYFNYDMIVGESLVLDLTQPLFTLTSNFRGSLRGIINPNSTISSFVFNSGTIAISVNVDLFNVGEDSVDSFVKWKTQYWSIDKACLKNCSQLGTLDE